MQAFLPKIFEIIQVEVKILPRSDAQQSATFTLQLPYNIKNDVPCLNGYLASGSLQPVYWGLGRQISLVPVAVQ